MGSYCGAISWERSVRDRRRLSPRPPAPRVEDRLGTVMSGNGYPSVMTILRSAVCFAISIALPLLAAAQDASPPAPPPPAERSSDMDKAGKIVSQPARDVGIAKTKIPPVLQRAAEGPYTLDGLDDCGAIAARLGELDTALGPDFDDAPGKGETLVAAGGKAVVNSIIPFRGVVREISGAAAADRRLAAATDAGIAQRGFLRGVYITRRCQPGQ